jgi:hypothetical protein
MPTCCQYAPNGQDWWCASPSSSAVASAFAEVLADMQSDLSSPDHVDIQVLENSMHEDIRLLDNRLNTLCNLDVVKNISEAEQMVHELHVVVIGMTVDLIARNAQFKTDYRRALTNVGLQCTDRVCQTTLSILGTALGYVGWLEIIASALVLLAYFRLDPSQRLDLSQLTAIATDAPELPQFIRALSGRAFMDEGELDELVRQADERRAASERQEAIAKAARSASNADVTIAAAGDSLINGEAASPSSQDDVAANAERDQGPAGLGRHTTVHFMPAEPGADTS